MDESGEEEDEIVDVEEVDDDEQGFLNIESTHLQIDPEEDNEEEAEQENNNEQSSEHEIEQSAENEGEEQSESDESESSIDDLSEEEQFSDHENETFPIDNPERHYEFDLPSSDSHMSHLRDSMQQATQYDDNFDMHMNHYLDPTHIMPSFEVMQLPTAIPSTSTTEGATQEQQKTLEDKPKRGRVAKSALLSQAEQVFRDSLKNLHNERDILNFIRYVDQFLTSTYGVSIFEVRRAAARREGSTSEHLEVRRKFPKRNMTTNAILQSPQSPLIRLNLREIINYKTFNLLEPQEKDSLLQHLPEVDKTSKESIESMFSSAAFLSNLPTFQEMLSMGEFENDKDQYLQYLKGKKKRETLDAWKEKYYEEYWGQKLKNKETVPEEPQPTFSFVEWSKKHAEEDATVSFPTHDFIKNPQHEEHVALEDGFKEQAPKRGRKKKAKESEDEMEEEKHQVPKAETKPVIKKESENDNYEVEEDEEDDDGKPRKRKREKKADRDYAPTGKKRERSSSGNSFRNCAYEILQREQKPLSASEIIKMALKEGLITTTGKTPQNTLASVLYCEMKKDTSCPFTKVGPMTFGLKEFNHENVMDEEGKPKKKKKKSAS